MACAHINPTIWFPSFQRREKPMTKRERKRKEKKQKRNCARAGEGRREDNGYVDEGKGDPTCEPYINRF